MPSKLPMTLYKYHNLTEWLDALENLSSQEIILGLDRILAVGKRLDVLKPKAKVISVAGTNGKGSVVAALEAIYKEAGYQVASYTSPHLLTFNERIKINQHPIRDEDLIAAFCAVEEARNSTHLTYFEFTTLAALWYFSKNAPDILLLEVGMGGRLDATNIIDADLAIITTIDLDHQDYLGDNKEAIGFEKAGILRKNIPFIYADYHPPSSIVKKATELNCRSYFFGIHYKDSLMKTLGMDPQQLSLHPQSLSAAIMATTLLKASLPISPEHIKKSLEPLSLAGRLQYLAGSPSFLFDVAHNPQSVEYLAKYVKNLNEQGKIHAVFSALKNKDIPRLIAPLSQQVSHWYSTLLPSKRASSKKLLEEAFQLYNITPVFYKNPLLAFKAACSKASAHDLILVYGSFLTVGHILSTVPQIKLRRSDDIG